MKVVDILIDYIKEENDRSAKVLEFHHPEKMKTLLDLDVPDQGVNLQQLVHDCAVTLKYQVRTGNLPVVCLILSHMATVTPMAEHVHNNVNVSA